MTSRQNTKNICSHCFPIITEIRGTTISVSFVCFLKMFAKKAKKTKTISIKTKTETKKKL